MCEPRKANRCEVEAKVSMMLNRKSAWSWRHHDWFNIGLLTCPPYVKLSTVLRQL
jgi:hypothetical protein